MKALKGWRTVAVNAAMALVLVTDYLIAGQTILSQIIDDPKRAALLVVAVNVVNILLRFVTSTPVGKRE